MWKHWLTRAVIGRTAVTDPLQESDRPDAQFEAQWRGLVRNRLVLILGLMGAWAVGVAAQLVHLQVLEHDKYARRAQAQQENTTTVTARRGDITDRNGQLLAYSVQSFDLAANPALVADPAGEAAELCAALGDCDRAERAVITERLSRSTKKNVPLREARNMSRAAAMRVQALIDRRAKAGLPATLMLTPRDWRYYPKLDLGSQIIGFVRTDGQGGGGVESRFDKTIRGEDGLVVVLVDALGNELLTRPERAPVPGASIELTIDAVLQHVAERELAAGIRSAGAKAGAAIILDPNTGEILALASYPGFNPNLYWTSDEDARRNRAIQDLYEPGSTFKIVTASAALNEHVMSASDIIDTNPGVLLLPGRRITEDNNHNYGVLTFEDVLVRSSNVGAIKIGFQVGTDRLLQYVQRMGFGQQIAPDFSGEARGGVGFDPGGRLSDGGLASVSMGYQVNVTPIQVAAAASAIANGGLLMEPRILKATIRDGAREEVAPRVIRRVIQPETAAALTAIMEGVVVRGRGTAPLAALERYRVAGKTGTSKKLVNGRYSQTDLNTSFVGFVPSRNPAFTILVVVDTPRNGLLYGGTVAAPIFNRIAEAALQYAGVSPSVNPVPAVIVASDRRALVAPPARPVPPAAPTGATPRLTNVDDRLVMPDLTGLTLRDAVRVAQALGLEMTAIGDGVVVSQTPAAGTPVVPPGRGTLRLRRDGGSGR